MAHSAGWQGKLTVVPEVIELHTDPELREVRFCSSARLRIAAIAVAHIRSHTTPAARRCGTRHSFATLLTMPRSRGDSGRR